MIISSYKNQLGDHASLTVDFNEVHFPVKYVVSSNRGGSKEFPGTEQGARDASKHYNALVAEGNRRVIAKCMV